jgi:AcrR family transcriptional regulator
MVKKSSLNKNKIISSKSSISTKNNPISDKKRDRELTEKLLLTSAMKIFAEKGYDATTFKDIAKDSNVNEALIVRYFGSKKGLLEAILTNSMKYSANNCQRDYSKSSNLENALNEMLHDKCESMSQMSNFAKVIVSRSILDRDVAKTLQKKLYTVTIPELVKCLKKFQKSGEIPKNVDLNSLAYGISAFSFSIAFMVQIVHEEPKDKINKIYKEVLEYLIKGLKSS